MDEPTGLEPAILIRGLTKQYGKDAKVLDDLDMTVIKGTIYGLLGASGCGKTTLLGSILGSRKIQNGAISILGGPPGVVPVKSIGYMPQDIALVGEFSIKNVFQHQGWIFGMSNKEIEERHKFFENLLNLPPGHKLIKNLSGGQQRRVSLAVVLIQDPELLILDEPTVGLDPILRQNLWDYLVKITQEEKKTVVMTTHYIEEAKQANMVGLLRNGKMLAEGDPEKLMNEFDCSSLENLFVSLSTKQEENFSSTRQEKRLISKFDELKILNQKIPNKPLLEKFWFTNTGHTKALMSKNFIRYIRHPGTLIISLIFPLVQMSTVFLAIGRIPDDLKIGIVNEELGNYRNCEDYINDNRTIGGLRLENNRTCVYNALGCKFTEQIQKFIKNQVYFESIEKALVAVKEEKIHQVLFFPHNYSDAFSLFTDSGEGGDDEDFAFNKITVYRDEIDYTLGVYIEKEIYNSYIKFAEELASDCRWSKRFAKYPMVFNEPIYGKADLKFTDLIAPGMMAILALALPEAVSLLTFITEKNGGVWERTIISGIKPAEILMSYIITFGFISAVQVVEVFLFSYYVFDFQCKGSIIHALLLLYLLALVGVTIGILLSSISKNETEAIYGAIGISFPFFLLTGFFWPLEGMPNYLKHISYALPPTIPIESLNNIIFRGWDISNFNVYKGYLTSLGYIIIFIIINVVALKFEKK